MTSYLNLNWWRCGGCDSASHSNLRLILIWTGGGKIAQVTAPSCGIERSREFNAS